MGKLCANLIHERGILTYKESTKPYKARFPSLDDKLCLTCLDTIFLLKNLNISSEEELERCLEEENINVDSEAFKLIIKTLIH